MSEKFKKLCTPQAFVCVIALLFFGVMAFLFPYSGDDWAWGSIMGNSRLEMFFDNYNGRYFGNFLVLAITRSEVLKIVLMAVSYLFSCWLCYKYSGSKKTSVLVFSIFTFLLMSKLVFAQSVVWASGYSNYVPSAIISVGYLYMVKNITGQAVPEYPKGLVVATLLMGFSGALFMENITLFNICLGIAVIGYCLLKFKKIYLAHIGFLVGAIAGAAWMFSNTAYRAIASGDDSYRTSATGIEGILKQAEENLKVIYYNLFTNNVGICIVATVLLIALVIVFCKKSDSKIKKLSSIGLVIINILCIVPAAYKKAVLVFEFADKNSLGILDSDKFCVIITALFALSAVGIILLCVEKNRQFKMLLPLYCVPVVVAPLLVVTPIGPRCFFVSYLLLMVFLADLAAYLSDNVSEKTKKAFGGFVTAAVLAQVVFYLSIFVPIHKADVKRNEFAKMQFDNKEETIVVCGLQDEGYVWCSNLVREPWPLRYKLFHEIDINIPIKNVTVEEFDEYYEKYMNEH